MTDILIVQEELMEFEFETFSVFFDKQRKIWFLETYGDEDEQNSFILQDDEGDYLTILESELGALPFTVEMFDTLKEVVSNENSKEV